MTCQGQAWLLVAASAANAVIAPASLIGVKEVKREGVRPAGRRRSAASSQLLPPGLQQTKARLSATHRCFRSATSRKAVPMSIRKGPAWLPVASSAAKADAAPAGSLHIV
jgi:hypothetical protein